MLGFTSKQSIEGQITFDLGFECKEGIDIKMLDEKPSKSKSKNVVSFKLTAEMPNGDMHEKTFWVTNWNKIERAGIIVKHERIF